MKHHRDNELTNILTGSAGEYLVAGELCRRGYIASILLNNARGIDILCSNREAKKTVGIQVKTKRGASPEWLLGEKAEHYKQKNLFYIFVTLNDNQAPSDFYVVPSRRVAATVKKGHAKWLKTPGLKGRPHKDNAMRKFRDLHRRFLNRWDLLPL